MIDEPKKVYTDVQVKIAQAIMQQKIQEYTDIYKKMLDDEENYAEYDDEAFVELIVETTTGFECKMWVARMDIAKVLLEYNYPLFLAMGQPSPNDMWDKLAGIYGVARIDDMVPWMLLKD